MAGAHNKFSSLRFNLARPWIGLKPITLLFFRLDQHIQLKHQQITIDQKRRCHNY
jgi:hypothetical protein